MDPFRKGLGRSGSSFGRFWVLPGRFWGVPNRFFFQHGCKMGSKRAWGSILGRFWKGLGRIWEDVEGLLDALGRFLWGRIWLGPRFADFWTSVSWKSPLNYFGSETPALPRQLAWRHNARGSPDPPACWMFSHQGVSPLRGRSFAPLMWPSRIPPRSGYQMPWKVIFAVFSQFFAFLAYC